MAWLIRTQDRYRFEAFAPMMQGLAFTLQGLPETPSLASLCANMRWEEGE
jgi:hypothetical protein